MPSKIKTNVAYGRYPALINLANDPIIAQRAPNTHDKWEKGQEWIDELTNQAWLLTSYFAGNPIWTEIDAAGVIGGLAGFTIPAAGAAALTVNGAYSLTGAGAYTLALPAVSAVGNQIWITTTNAGFTQFTVTQGAGQQILYNAGASTPGVAGTLVEIAAGSPYVTVILVCTVANTIWNVASVTNAGLTLS